MTVEITAVDILGAGPGNMNDPLARALQRVTSKKGWHTDVFSHGHRLATGLAWLPKSSEEYWIDEGTTHALQEFDLNVPPFSPRSVVLTRLKETI